MEFIQALTAFTNGGKNEVLYILIPSGLLALIVGLATLILYRGSYYLGLGITLCLIALVFLIYGAGFVFGKYEKRFESVSKSYEKNKEQTIAKEIAAMKDYNRNTKRNFYGAGVVLLLALVFIFFINVRWLSGVATALIFLSFVTVLIEGGFSKIRADKYVSTLNKLAMSETKSTVIK